VFDPTPVLLEMKAGTSQRLYLQTDTHWAPDAMHQVALKLGDFLEKSCGLPWAPQDGLLLDPEKVTNLGDIAEMLKLPAGQTLFPKQTVTISKVEGTDGSPWEADRNGEVLLLGDSFSNIYSLEGMGWGTGAGFAEHLSYAIGRPIDKIVINAGGAFASRRDLASQLRRGIDRLAHKKIVVYEFSMRDLAQGDWKMMKLPESPEVAPVVTPPVAATPQKVDKALSAFKALTIKPSVLDLSLHKPVEIAVDAPAGSWMLRVYSADGKPVMALSSTGSTAERVSKTTWDGLNVQRSPVPVGTYTIRAEGTRPDGSAIEPLSQQLPVFDRKQKGAVKPPAPVVVKPLVKTQTIKTTVAPSKVATPPTGTKPTEEGLVVTGRIAARASTPKPGSVPYKDCLIALQLTDLKATGGTVKGPDIVVYVWGMRDNKLLDGAYNVGQVLRFKLVPWASVDSKYGGYNRQELDSDAALSWDAFWGEIK